MMTQLEKKLKAAMRRFGIGVSDSVVAAVSGGADSTAMLDSLARLRSRDQAFPRSILVAHLNHQLRGEESDRDEAFVKQLAAEYGLPVFTERIAIADHARQTKRNLEATARQLRYDFLQRVAEDSGAGFVLTAHTRDDQAETVLMRLLRGSGAEGLRGIAPMRPLGPQVKLVRPLLEVSRADVIAHCAQWALEFRTDSSNLSDDLTRNRIRQELLPLLRTFNPRSEEALARAAAIAAEDEDHLNRLSEDLLASSIVGLDEHESARLNIIHLPAAHTAIRRRVLRLWLRNIRGSLQRIDSKHLAAIERLILTGQSGYSIELPGRWVVRREFDIITLSQRSEIKQINPTPVPLVAGAPQIFGNYEIQLLRHLSRKQIGPSYEMAIEIAMLAESRTLDRLKLRTRIPGDTYIPVNSSHKIKLKTLMIRNKIPLSERNTHPVLVSAEDRIVWSPGLPVARESSIQDDDGECALVIAQKLRNP